MAKQKEASSPKLRERFIIEDLKRSLKERNQQRRSNSIKYRIEYLPKILNTNENNKRDSIRKSQNKG